MIAYFGEIWRELILPLWRRRLSVACGIFGLWLLATQPLFATRPACYDENGRVVSVSGKMTPWFFEEFVGSFAVMRIPIKAVDSTPRVRLIDRLDRSASLAATTGSVHVLLRLRLQIGGFLPDGAAQSADHFFPNMFREFGEPTCDTVREVAFYGGQWAISGPIPNRATDRTE